VRIIGVFVVFLAFLATTANLSFAAHFMGRVYPGVSLNGQDLSGLDRVDLRHVLAEQVGGYKLKLKVGDAEYQLAPQEVGVSYDLEATADVIMSAGRGHFMALAGLHESRSTSAAMAYRVDRDKLALSTAKLADIGTLSPVDAQLVMEGVNPKIEPDKPGLAVDRAKLAAALLAALIQRNESLGIDLQLQPAAIRAEALEPVAEEARQLTATTVELKHEGKVFKPSAAEIATWLTFPAENASRKVAVDTDRVKAYIAGLAKVIDVRPVAKRLTLVNGEVKSEEGGVDGLAVDQNVLAAEVAAKLTLSRKLTIDIPTRPVAYKTEYNRTTVLDGRYIEVNLSSQRLWAWQDKEVVYSAPITSGATGHGFGTIQGLFAIYSKARSQWLDGRSYGWNYRVYVDYWMPFHGGYGLHDADWRSSFGGPDYYWGGSHGCVNMAKPAAAWLFDWATVGTPVWVHH
jgi:lipoprotein-anchoring transpeptidase ErfK/SrfK